jgi:CheY-like chemotaxis protein
MLLEQMGHTVVSAEGFAQAFRACKQGNYDLLVLGHSVTHDDKIAIIEEAKRRCPCPILALLRSNESPVPNIERSIDSGDPKAFVDAVHEMLTLQPIQRGGEL